MDRTDPMLTPSEASPGLFGRFRRNLGLGSVIRGSGSYRLVRKLGQGGMGCVFLAEKRGRHGFSKLMAIKVMPKSGLTARSRTMFSDEARLTANLIHPNIVQTYQLGETRNDFFIVMEHVFGVTLLDFIERHTELGMPIPIDYGVFILMKVLGGLHYAHNKHSRDGVHLGIVHRDICPSNIMISFRGVPKLTDFGVAKAKTSHVENEQQVVFGKYPYMAPEQVRREGTEPRSDLYSLALVAFELFTGELAHPVENTHALLDDLAHTITPPHELNDDVPRELSKVILKAMSIAKDERFRSAKTMRRALETFLLKEFMFPDEDGLAEYLCEIFPQAAKHRWW